MGNIPVKIILNGVGPKIIILKEVGGPKKYSLVLIDPKKNPGRSWGTPKKIIFERAGGPKGNCINMKKFSNHLLRSLNFENIILQNSKNSEIIC